MITICGKVKSRPYIVWEPTLSHQRKLTAKMTKKFKEYSDKHKQTPIIKTKNQFVLSERKTIFLIKTLQHYQHLITEQKQLLQKFDQILEKKCWCFDQDKQEVEKTVQNINTSKVYQHSIVDQQILEQNQAAKQNEITSNQFQVQNNNNQINEQIEDLSLSIFSNANTIAENQLNQQIDEVNKIVNLQLSENQSAVQQESQQIAFVNNQQIPNPIQLNQSIIENANALIVLNDQEVNKQQIYGQNKIFQQTIKIYDSENESGDEMDSEHEQENLQTEIIQQNLINASLQNKFPNHEQFQQQANNVWPSNQFMLMQMQMQAQLQNQQQIPFNYNNLNNYQLMNTFSPLPINNQQYFPIQCANLISQSNLPVLQKQIGKNCHKNRQQKLNRQNKNQIKRETDQSNQ